MFGVWTVEFRGAPVWIIGTDRNAKPLFSGHYDPGSTKALKITNLPLALFFTQQIQRPRPSRLGGSRLGLDTHIRVAVWPVVTVVTDVVLQELSEVGTDGDVQQVSLDWIGHCATGLLPGLLPTKKCQRANGLIKRQNHLFFPLWLSWLVASVYLQSAGATLWNFVRLSCFGSLVDWLEHDWCQRASLDEFWPFSLNFILWAWKTGTRRKFIEALWNLQAIRGTPCGTPFIYLLVFFVCVCVSSPVY